VVHASGEEKKVSFSKTELVTPEDVDAYVEELHQRWLALVKSGKRIGV